MKEKARQLIKHPLIYGTSVVMIGTLFANFFNFLFNLFMSRNLSVAEYGVLASIVALIAFPALAVGAISPMIVQFAGKYFATGELAMVRGLYLKVSKWLLIFAFSLCSLFLIFIPQISDFFHIENRGILLLTDVIIFIIVLSVINSALIQAKLAFAFQSFVSLGGALVKVIAGTILVLSGFAVGGAVFAFFLSFLVSYLLSFIQLKFIFDKKSKPVHIDTKELFTYGIPSAVTLIAMTSFISTDIMLVKHFFSPTDAGIYAGLSLVGKVIFFLSAPIGTVMFPVIVQKYSRNENFTNTFKFSLLLVLLPSIALNIFYYLLPEFTILFFLKKTEYLAASSLLWLFGLVITLFSLLTIVTNFYLSIKKTNVFIPISIGAILQVILIYLYHQTFLQIITITFWITFLLVLCLLLYYPYATQKKL
jgi:O-antigen/teichoic acid export membrane protein